MVGATAQTAPNATMLVSPFPNVNFTSDPTIAFWRQLLGRFLQIHCSGYLRAPFCRSRQVYSYSHMSYSHVRFSWPVATDILSLAANTLFFFRPWSHQQLYWKPFCWVDYPCEGAFYQYGRRYSEFQGCDSPIRQGRGNVEATAISKARKMDSLGNTDGSCGDSVVGCDCVCLAFEWKGWSGFYAAPSLANTISSREKTN